MRHCFLYWLCIGFSITWGSERLSRKGEELIKLIGNQSSDITQKYSREYLDFNPMIRYPKLVQRDGDWWFIENFRHGIVRSKKIDLSTALWTSAVIDGNRVKGAAFLIGKFRNTSLNLGHLFSLFEFESGSIYLPGGKKLDHLVISFEACRRKGEKYSMWDGAWSKYGACYVIGSFNDVLQKSIIFYKGMDRYNLDLNPAELKAFLRVSLEDSTGSADLKREYYNTVKNSCVTRQFDLLNMILPQDKRIKTWWNLFDKPVMRTWQSFWPGHTRQTLTNSGLLKSEELMTNRLSMEDQLKSLVNIDR